MSRLAGKSIVIVGATSGLGLSAARACLAAGANVVAVGRDAGKAAAAFSDATHRVPVCVGDASDPTTAERAVREAVDTFGRLDGLYHVAGGSGRAHGDGPLHEMTDDGWTRTLRHNLDSVFFSNRAALRQFLRQGQGGSLVNMASVLAFAPVPRYFATHAYASAKAAIIGLTQTTAAYYAPHGIRVNAVAPALVETPMARRAVQNEQIVEFVRRKQPLDGGRVGDPADLDGAIVFLLSDEAKFVTGQVLAVDGGWSVTDAAGGIDE